MLKNYEFVNKNNDIKYTLENGKILRIKNIKIKNVENRLFEVNFIRENEQEYVHINGILYNKHM